MNDSISDFMHELTGVVGENIFTCPDSPSESIDLKLKTFMMNPNNILIARHPTELFFREVKINPQKCS